MKIKKNLSDAEMLKNFNGQETFETVVLPEEKAPLKTQPPKTVPLVSLPEDTLGKLDKAVLQLRVKMKQQGVSEVKWQVLEGNGEIILKATAKKTV